jgi:DNA-binding MarR family transcriptional regulator
MENLSQQQKRILEFIRDSQNKEINITQISKGIKSCYGNVLKSINKLERLGLINKIKTPNNRIKIILNRK